MEHIPTEISFRVEFYKDNLCFTKMATLVYVSLWDVDLCSLPWIWGEAMTTLINGVWCKRSCVISRLGHNKDTASIWLSLEMLDLESQSPYWEEAQATWRGHMWGFQTTVQLGPQLIGSINGHTRTSPQMILAPTLQAFRLRPSPVGGDEAMLLLWSTVLTDWNHER